MAQYPNSLLIRITDLLYTRLRSLGSILGTAPPTTSSWKISYTARQAAPRSGRRNGKPTLKPIDYFYPERDIAGGALAPGGVKKWLVDKFEDKVRVSIEEKEDLVGMLVQDTRILREANAVDYSLFFVRYPYPRLGADEEIVPSPPGRTSPCTRALCRGIGSWCIELSCRISCKRRFAGESVDGAGEELEFLLEGGGRWTDEYYSYGDGVSGEVFEDDRGNCRG